MGADASYQMNIYDPLLTSPPKISISEELGCSAHVRCKDNNKKFSGTQISWSKAGIIQLYFLNFKKFKFLKIWFHLKINIVIWIAPKNGKNLIYLVVVLNKIYFIHLEAFPSYSLLIMLVIFLKVQNELLYFNTPVLK